MAGMKWTSIIAAMLIASLSTGCKKSALDTAELRRADSAVFDLFETVFFARGELLQGTGGYKRLSQRDADMLRVPFAVLLYGLNSLGKQATAKILANADAALVGAKDFRGPEGHPPGLGGVQSRFGSVLVLGNQSTFEISKVAGKSRLMASAEATVWKWLAPPTEGHPQPYTFYATQVAHSYLLISNNLDDLHSISAKLSETDPVQSLSGIRDWEIISRHEVWGYRRYRHDESNTIAAGTSEVLTDAQDLAFFADPKQKSGVLRLFSPTAGTADKMNGTHTLSPFKETSRGSWETTIQLAGDEKTSDQMFAVMSLFGFGVYV